MECQKTTNLLDILPNQPSKFKTKNWFEINDNPRETYNTNSQIKFKTSILMSSLCDYGYACILLNWIIRIFKKIFIKYKHTIQ